MNDYFFRGSLYLLLGTLFLSLTAAFAEEPDEIDWSDPTVAAYMQPDYLCPFTVEIYPKSISPGDVPILKLDFQNKLSFDAYALADEDFSFLCRSGVLSFSGNGSQIEYLPLRPDERNLALWRKLAPGERLTIYYPLDLASEEIVSPDFAVLQRIGAGSNSSGVCVLLKLQFPSYQLDICRTDRLYTTTRRDVELADRPNFDEAIPKIRSGEATKEEIAEFYRQMEEYVQKYPTPANQLRVERAKLETIDLAKTEQNADGETICPNVEALKAGLDSISDETVREGLRAYFYNNSNEVVRKALTRYPKRVGKDRINAVSKI